MNTPFPPGPKFSLIDTVVRQMAGKPGIATLQDMMNLLRPYNGITYYKIGPFHIYILWDPDLVHEAVVEQAPNFGKGYIVQRSFGRLMGNGLFTSDGDFWKRQRKLMQPVFHSKRIETYAQTMVEHTQRMLNEWNAGTLEISQEMMKLTLSIVSKVLFNADVSNDTHSVSSAMAALVDNLISQSGGIVKLPAWIPTPTNVRETKAINTLDEIIHRIIAQRRASGEDTGDLMSMLLMARDEDGSVMSDKQLRDESVTLFIAGHETTAVTLTWAWYLLSQHPEVEAKLHAELEQVLGGRAPTVHDQLPYTDSIIKETMRLYPPVPLIPRTVMEDTVVGGYRFVKNGGVLLAAYAAHRNERYFPEAERFLPERWEGDFEKQIPRYAYFPFGGGPRICIGNQFALMEARLLLATIAQRYRLALEPGQTIEPISFVSLRPKVGIRMQAMVREPLPTP
ncbi:MAG: cytochrome P450 [Anaerolineae bacterium]